MKRNLDDKDLLSSIDEEHLRLKSDDVQILSETTYIDHGRYFKQICLTFFPTSQYLTCFLFLIHFAAVVKVKKNTEKNEGVVNLVTKILDSPTTLNTKEIFDNKSSYASFLYLFGTCMVPAAKLKKMVCENQYDFEKIHLHSPQED